MKIKRKLLPDKYLLILYIALLIAGLVAIYGAQTVHEPNTKYFSNHLNLLLLMFGFSIIMLLVPDFFDIIDNNIPIILFSTIILLGYVLIFGITVAGSFAKRWIYIPPGFTIQPSELAKITISIYMASVLAKKGEKLTNIKKGLVPPLIILIIVSVLIAIEPDLGTALLFAMVCFSMFLYGGIPLRSLIISWIFLLLVSVVFVFNVPYMKSRVDVYLDPEKQSEEDTYQMKRATLAFNYGGLTGIPDENIRDVSTHLPAAITDFIFASIAQRYGLIGNLIILILFVAFTARGLIVSYRIKENIFLKNLSFGLTMFISIQAFLNMMVATLIIPTTGLPLPFISYGRNALVINMIMYTILLKITQRREL